MNKEDLAKKINEKVGLGEDMSLKVAEVLTGPIATGNISKEGVAKTLKEKFNIGEEQSGKVYDAIAGALSGSVVDMAKKIFGKK